MDPLKIAVERLGRIERKRILETVFSPSRWRASGNTERIHMDA
jgi:hypothetical protein